MNYGDVGEGARQLSDESGGFGKEVFRFHVTQLLETCHEAGTAGAFGSAAPATRCDAGVVDGVKRASCGAEA